jgi:hypothetical protein
MAGGQRGFKPPKISFYVSFERSGKSCWTIYSMEPTAYTGEKTRKPLLSTNFEGTFYGLVADEGKTPQGWQGYKLQLVGEENLIYAFSYLFKEGCKRSNLARFHGSLSKLNYGQVVELWVGPHKDTGIKCGVTVDGVKLEWDVVPQK